MSDHEQSNMERQLLYSSGHTNSGDAEYVIDHAKLQISRNLADGSLVRAKRHDGLEAPAGAPLLLFLAQVAGEIKRV